ncbi:HAD domain-containing protein [Catellatospora bangladeshensis]|uniref:Uncharacterized protein n=1 Tax=Catellatospora bangladeshensis TaxID=310355 RepID=A0A8J3JK78_9ACTN|nr:hypothetical protein [Catellatospora bangladeshensis]GIF82208.1 hypothetical protein Cba03nite_35570 [Catellatospora bangladeshensis]
MLRRRPAVSGVPIWLLDIDGVINAVTDEPDRRVWPEQEWIRTTAPSNHDLEWPILAATPVLDFLRRVHEQGRAEIWWHSTWQHNSVNVGTALGLPVWPVRESPEFGTQETELATPLARTRQTWWKLPAAQRVLAQGRPLLWTDDDARRQLRAADTRPWGASALVVAPPVEAGLTPRQLRRIDRWLTNWS